MNLIYILLKRGKIL